MGDAKAERERQYKGRHHIQRRRYAYGEERLDTLRLADLRQLDVLRNHRREEGLPHSVRHEAGQHRGAVCQKSRDEEQLARTLADVGDGRCDKADDNQRDKESEELAEERIERNEYANRHFRGLYAKSYTESYGNDNLRQQANLGDSHVCKN